MHVHQSLTPMTINSLERQKVHDFLMDRVGEVTLHKSQKRIILDHSELQGHRHWAMLDLSRDYGFIPVTEACSSHILSKTCTKCARALDVCERMPWQGDNTFSTRKVITFITFDSSGSATEVIIVYYNMEDYKVKPLSSISCEGITDQHIFRVLKKADEKAHPCGGCLCTVS